MFHSRQRRRLANQVNAGSMADIAGKNVPRFPDGYADPELTPLYPQTAAEIMGGRIPLDASRALIPESLDDVVVGPATAEEIRWIR